MAYNRAMCAAAHSNLGFRQLLRGVSHRQIVSRNYRIGYNIWHSFALEIGEGDFVVT